MARKAKFNPNDWRYAPDSFGRLNQGFYYHKDDTTKRMSLKDFRAQGGREAWETPVSPPGYRARYKTFDAAEKELIADIRDVPSMTEAQVGEVRLDAGDLYHDMPGTSAMVQNAIGNIRAGADANDELADIGLVEKNETPSSTPSLLEMSNKTPARIEAVEAGGPDGLVHVQAYEQIHAPAVAVDAGRQGPQEIGRQLVGPSVIGHRLGHQLGQRHLAGGEAPRMGGNQGVADGRIEIGRHLRLGRAFVE